MTRVFRVDGRDVLRLVSCNSGWQRIRVFGIGNQLRVPFMVEFAGILGLLHVHLLHPVAVIGKHVLVGGLFS